MREPRIGVGVLVSREDDLLLIQRTNAHGAGTWSTPGGHLDFNEEPAACAAREVKEETGVDVADIVFVGVTNDRFLDDGLHYVTLWFQASWAGGTARVADPREMSDVGWFPRSHPPAPVFLSLQNFLEGRCLAPRSAP